MTISAASEVRFDPYDVELIADPYPVFARLRDEAPLSQRPVRLLRPEPLRRRQQGARSTTRPTARRAARSWRLIKANLEIPSGMLIFEDPPITRRAPQTAVADVHPAQDRPRSSR